MRCASIRIAFLRVAALGSFALSACTVTNAADELSYNRQIRPLLSDRCFQCHGPDEGHRAADLRLDESESAYTVIEPGDLTASEFVERITSTDPDLRMPPPDSGKTLEAEEIELLKEWIASGAEYQPHWSFVPPQRMNPPAAKNQTWPSGAIDQFILARLENQGLRPSGPADRIVLLRRLTFDLTGLPPTRQEVRDFLADDSPQAYERVVDRLLASPHYGEHMARFWLDAVRYGDTHGLHLDNYREMWPYRDWVVRAFNDNLPWDKFTTMQIAGDLIPDATLDDRIASGFNRCHITTNEGGSIAEEVYVRNVVDRVSTTGTVFLGLTMGCAVCHDHKFDPITAKDFYSSFAFFNNLDGPAMDGNVEAPAPSLAVPSAEQQAEQNRLDKKIAELEAKLGGVWPELDSEQTLWEAEEFARLTATDEPYVAAGQWHSVGPFRAVQRALYNSKYGPEGKPIDLEQTFELPTGETVGWTPQPGWADDTTITDFPYIGEAANFVYRRIDSKRPRTVKAELGVDDGVKVYLNGKLILEDKKASSVKPGEFELELPVVEGENHLLLKIVNHGGLTGFHFKLLDQKDSLPAEVLAALQIAEADRTDKQQRALREHFRRQVSQDAGLKEVLKQLADTVAAKQKLLGEIPTTLVMKERHDPKPAYLLNRGEYSEPDKELGPLPRNVPSFLPPLPAGAPRDRMGYAMWLVDETHPLMARVTVNRFWQQCFGTGIVETAGDFGSQGSWPSHPELLDWLAVDFRESGWDVKRFMKQLVMSSAYRQTSRITPELLAADPKNRLLGRGPRFRLDAEMLRDQALAVSGLLVNKLGGPSVKPPQPDGIWKAVGYGGSNTKVFVADKGADKVHRRSLYTFWKRTAPPPQMTTFDSPTRESCTVRRERTNTPLQALLLLNDPQYVEAARKLAERAIKAGGGNTGEIASDMFELATLRKPEPDELTHLVATYQASLARYESDRPAVDALLAVGGAAADPEVDRTEAAAWTLVANAILNLDEVVTKE